MTTLSFIFAVISAIVIPVIAFYVKRKLAELEKGRTDKVDKALQSNDPKDITTLTDDMLDNIDRLRGPKIQGSDSRGDSDTSKEGDKTPS